jgi:hypothetical protein
MPCQAQAGGRAGDAIHVSRAAPATPATHSARVVAGRRGVCADLSGAYGPCARACASERAEAPACDTRELVKAPAEISWHQLPRRARRLTSPHGRRRPSRKSRGGRRRKLAVHAVGAADRRCRARARSGSGGKSVCVQAVRPAPIAALVRVTAHDSEAACQPALCVRARRAVCRRGLVRARSAVKGIGAGGAAWRVQVHGWTLSAASTAAREAISRSTTLQ